MYLSRIACFAVMIAAFAGARAEPDAAAASRARLLMNSGIAHERQGQNQEALVDFTQALQLRALSQSDRARAYYDRGVALDALDQTKDAIGDYSEAARLEPGFAPALNNRANAYRRLGQLTEAKRDYLAALASSDVSREYPYYGLGQIAEKLGDINSARDYYSKALAANPSFAIAAQSLVALRVTAAPAQTITLRSPDERLHGVLPERASIRASAPALRRIVPDSGPKRTAGETQIQLGAFHDEAAATEGLKKVMDKAQTTLRGLALYVVPVDLPGKGRMWRLRVAVTDRATATRLCAELSAQGLACFAARD